MNIQITAQTNPTRATQHNELKTAKNNIPNALSPVSTSNLLKPHIIGKIACENSNPATFAALSVIMSG